MMRRFSSHASRGLLAAFVLWITPDSFAFDARLVVDNFGLMDQKGDWHELYYYAKDPETKAVVLFVQGNGCPLVRKQIPALNRLRERYASRGVRFWMINANAQDAREEIAAEAETFGVTMPVLIDRTQLVAEALALTRTAEVLLVEANSWRVVYRGALSDQLDYESTKPEATKHFLMNALEALLEDRPIEVAQTPFSGCKINLEHAEAVPPESTAYSETIAPLLERRCAHCHREGGIGPWAMSGHRKVSGWAEMMEEVLLTGRMPPWQGDPHYGEFQNDDSLTDAEARTLVHWIRAGAPRGEGADPLEAVRPLPREWELGEPDYVVEIPAQQIPSEGTIDYRYINVELPFTEDVWVRAVDVRPGNTRVLHHVIAWSVLGEGDKARESSLAGYAPGMGPDLFPEGTGRLIRVGSRVRFQLHYTTSGKAEEDRTRLGLYLAKEPPAHRLHTGVVMDTKFEIPPRAREFSVSKTNRFEKAAWLYSMNPHMHVRGKAMRYEAQYPDGTTEVLLSVPRYHFNWQRSYRLAKPKFLPAGTGLAIYATWDNSALNHSNPDPERAVGWGEQTFDEMFFASYVYIDADPSKPSTASAALPAE